MCEEADEAEDFKHSHSEGFISPEEAVFLPFTENASFPPPEILPSSPLPE